MLLISIYFYFYFWEARNFEINIIIYDNIGWTLFICAWFCLIWFLLRSDAENNNILFFYFIEDITQF